MTLKTHTSPALKTPHQGDRGAGVVGPGIGWSPSTRFGAGAAVCASSSGPDCGEDSSVITPRSLGGWQVMVNFAVQTLVSYLPVFSAFSAYFCALCVNTASDLHLTQRAQKYAENAERSSQLDTTLRQPGIPPQTSATRHAELRALRR